jgi:microcin C transport system substrate-binding protein
MKLFLALILSIFSFSSFAEETAVTHGLSMHGDMKYKENFKHFDYADSDAPKGGTLREHVVGSYDNLNGFIFKGLPASNLELIYDTLLQNSDDEPFSEYARLAESVEHPDDNSYIRFNLNKAAKFHDGAAVTPEDVIWTFETLKEKGLPFYRSYYNGIKKVTKTGDHQVTFTFENSKNKELPLILGQLPVLPKHFWEGKKFDATTLEKPLGSGPYQISNVEAGKSITYERVKDYWGADIAVNKGRYNFDTVKVDYYRDATVAVEALLANEYDYRVENIAKTWATTYKDAQAVKDGDIKIEELENDRPAGMQAFVMNLRRPLFQDIAVRKAINLAFDYEWSNKQFAYGAYTRTDSFFENSELAATGKPSKAELVLLEPFKDQLPADLFEETFKLPKTKGDGNNRKQLKEAIELLEEAGYELGEDGYRRDPKTGKKLSFEIIENQPTFERWIAPMIANLKKIGIEASFRTVDTAQYQNRILAHDYDMTVQVFGQSLSPGNEQIEYWHSAKADISGSRNWAGIQDPVVDALVDTIVHAETREDLVTATRALDRVLLWNYYVVPQWHLNSFRVAHWDKFGAPSKRAPYNLNILDTWWVKK